MADDSHRSPVDHSVLKEVLADYAQAMIASYDIGRVLYRLTDQVVDVLGVTGAGVSIGRSSEGLQFVTATDEVAARLEEVQIAFGDGPCHDAYRTGRRVVSPDLGDEDRWPKFTPAAYALGARAAAGIPMPSETRTIGALNIYVDTPHEWTEEELDAAQLLADMAAGYVIHAQALDEARTLNEQLQRALDSRVVIEQAKGIIAARHEIDLADAFERLRTYARSQSRRAHEVAREIVDGNLEV